MVIITYGPTACHVMSHPPFLRKHDYDFEELSSSPDDALEDPSLARRTLLEDVDDLRGGGTFEQAREGSKDGADQ